MKNTRQPPVNKHNPNKSDYVGGSITKGLPMERNSKTRGNYATGWCKRVEDKCVGDCDTCVRECNFKTEDKDASK